MKLSTKQRIAALGIAAAAVIAIGGTVSGANGNTAGCHTWHPQGVVVGRYQHTLNPQNASEGQYQHTWNPENATDGQYQHTLNPEGSADGQYQHTWNPENASDGQYQHTLNPAGDHADVCAPSTTTA